MQITRYGIYLHELRIFLNEISNLEIQITSIRILFLIGSIQNVEFSLRNKSFLNKRQAPIKIKFCIFDD